MEFLESFYMSWRTIILVIAILLGAVVLTKIVRWLISKSFATASEKLNVDPTRYRFFKNAASLIIWVIATGALVLLIPKLKALAITIFAGAGILVALIGLAAQQAFSNIVSGVFIVLFRPFRVGDLIKVGSREYGVPQVVVRVMGYGDFSVNLRADVWTDQPFQARQMHSDINKAFKKRFDEEGIEIPFPYRTLVYKKELPANYTPGTDE